MAARRRGNWGRGSRENYAYLGLHHSLALRRQSQHDTRAKAPRPFYPESLNKYKNGPYAPPSGIDALTRN